MERTGIVDTISTSLLSIAAVVNIGDIAYYKSTQNILAYQREQELFFGNEGRLGEFKVFHIPSYFEPIDEAVYMTFNHVNPYIHVGCIKTQAVSSTALLQVGNGKLINAQTRLMNVRQLMREPERRS